MDITIAVLALVAALPLIVIICVLIVLTIGRPVFYAHRRVGYGGRFFQCYKFRTMIPNADVALENYLAQNPSAAREWKEKQKLTNDPRVTRFGRFLRKTSLDELPQLINVLLGDMSCVGPRPVTFEELERYGACLRHYLATRPGLTGLWQVSGRSSTDFTKRVLLDEKYVVGWSLLTDFSILLRTPLALTRAKDVV